MAVFRALKTRTFRLLWTGQTVSRLGDAAYRLALAWWVVAKTGSAATMGIVIGLSYLPLLLFLLIGGVIADRLPRLKLMLISDLARAVLLLVMTVLAAADRLSLWHVFLASFTFGLVDAFFQPAYASDDSTPGVGLFLIFYG